MRNVGKFGNNDGHLNDITQQFASWQSSLPGALQLNADPCCVEGNLELTMLLALSYRYQCFFYRALRSYYFSIHDDRHTLANQQLKMAMLGTDNLIGKMMTNGNLRMLPLSL
ncbi:hypothetical protein PFICI_06746 [Pestalotiopsis fici W106-1]|uniref:Transcription factor domain-containing protein n=1 Tax=Pestalotiopsis fici (strain W106-1 / CGMCC3.15140) TaxID=1229662 RepID=W3X6V4_PESFW|nr:uncharacterized protein PFICI_06746 [Pestalotiopsis fici W106-1]ETS81744.1 hypothetical protein PFICI_06746 [Pestalotiopsis fici W106-1]